MFEAIKWLHMLHRIFTSLMCRYLRQLKGLSQMDSNRAAPTNGHDSWNVTINHLRFGGARHGQYGQCIQCIMFFQFPRRLDWNHDAPCHWLAWRINPWQFAVTHRNPILGQARKRLADGVTQHAKHVEFRLTNGSLFEGWNHRSIQRLEILFDAKLLNHPSATGWWFQPLWKIWSQWEGWHPIYHGT